MNDKEWKINKYRSLSVKLKLFLVLCIWNQDINTDPVCTLKVTIPQNNACVHTHAHRFELTVGPVAPVWCTPAAPSPVCVWGVCLPGSAEDFCFETQPLTAGPLAGGPAPPGNPETQMRGKSLCPTICVLAAVKNTVIRIHRSSEQMK